MMPYFRLTAPIWVLIVIASAFIFGLIYSVQHGVSRGERLEARIYDSLPATKKGARVAVFGLDGRVYVDGADLCDNTLSIISDIALSNNWVIELDIRNTRATKAFSDRLIRANPNKRILTRFNAELHPFLYD